MPSSCGRWGSTPPWATVGRVGSACSNARFTQRSSTDLFHDGSCWRTNRRDPAGRASRPRPAARRRPARRGRTTGRSTGGGRAASTASRAWRTASRRICGVAPLQREVLQQQHAELVGGVVQLVGRRCGPGRAGASRPGLDGELDVAADVGGLASARPGRVGQEVGALEEQPLAVDRADPVVPGHLAQPGAARSPCRSPRRRRAARRRSRSAAGRRARAATTAAGWAMSSDHSISLVPAASGVLGLADDLAVGGRAQPHGAGVRRCRGGRAGAGGRGSRRRRGTARAAGRATGPVSYTSTGAPEPAGVPVPVDGLGVLEQPGDVAPAGGAPLGGARHLDGQHVVVAEARRAR